MTNYKSLALAAFLSIGSLNPLPLLRLTTMMTTRRTGAESGNAGKAAGDHTRQQECAGAHSRSKDDEFTVNQKDFELVAGQGYRWKITSAAGLEYKFVTDLFRNVWMNQIVINDLEVHMNGGPAWLEFDAPGTINVQFTAVRPGKYTWSVPDLADKGMKGKITIK